MGRYDERIREFEEEIRKTQYNKATQHHIGLVKAKIARLRERQESASAQGGKGQGFAVRKTGDATVILLGFPSVGKSTLLNKLTNAESETGHYDFTTLTVVPGLLEYKGARIQLLDCPGVVPGAARGTGRGREVLSIMQNADLLLILVDATKPEALEAIKKEVYDFNIRINQRRPDVRIRRTGRGGIQIGSTVKLSFINDEMIKGVCRELGLVNADVLIRDDITVEQLIDVIEGNKIYLNAVIALNKIDLVTKQELKRLKKAVSPDICVSAGSGLNLEGLKQALFVKLEFIRVYCKEAGKKADMDEPLILKQGSTIEVMCRRLHKDFVKRFRFARVWGSSRFPGQRLMLNYEIKDRDVVELHVN